MNNEGIMTQDEWHHWIKDNMDLIYSKKNEIQKNLLNMSKRNDPTEIPIVGGYYISFINMGVKELKLDLVHTETFNISYITSIYHSDSQVDFYGNQIRHNRITYSHHPDSATIPDWKTAYQYSIEGKPANLRFYIGIPGKSSFNFINWIDRNPMEVKE
jgi:hypothetical protein